MFSTTITRLSQIYSVSALKYMSEYGRNLYAKDAEDLIISLLIKILK